MRKLFRCFLLLLLFQQAVPFLFSNVEQIKCPMGRDYDLYLPEKIDPNQTYWLVCYVHGANGTACDHVLSLKRFVERGDCIGVAPSFPHGFQLLKNGTDQQLIGILHQLSKKYKLHPKLFIYGHSAGGQFAHRFMLMHPDWVIGCEACSSGTWATGGVYQSLTAAAQNIPLAIACGAEDRGKKGRVIAQLGFHDSGKACSIDENSEWNRIEWFKKFQQQLEEDHFFFKAKIFSGESHYVKESEQTSLAMESFLLGTCGMLPVERSNYDAAIAALRKNKGEGKKDLVTIGLQQLQQTVDSRSKETLRTTLLSQGWNVSEAALDQCLKASKNFVKEKMNFFQKQDKLSLSK